MNTVEVAPSTRRPIRLEDIGAERLSEVVQKHADATGQVYRILNAAGNVVAQPGRCCTTCKTPCDDGGTADPPSTGMPLEQAAQSHEPVIFECEPGIYASVAAIRVAGDMVGFVVGSKSVAAPLSQNEVECLEKQASEFCAFPAELGDALRQLPVIETQEGRIESARTLLELVNRLARICWFEQQLRSVEDSNAELGTLSNAREIGDVILARVGAIFGDVNSVAYKIQENQLHLIAKHLRPGVNFWEIVQMGEGHVGWVAETGQALLLPNSNHQDIPPLERNGVSNHDLQSELTVPMMSGANSKPVGVLQIASPEGEAFREDDQRLLQMLANRAGSHLDRITVAQVWHIEELQPILQQILEVGLQMLNFASGDIGLLDSSGKVLEIWAAIGPLKDHLPYRVDSSMGISGKVMRENRTIVVDNVFDNPEYKEILRREQGTPFGEFLENVGCTAKTPLRIGETVVGNLCVHWPQPNQVPPEAPRFLELLAERISAFLKTSRQQERSWTDTILARDVASGVDIMRGKKDLFQALAEQARRVTGSYVSSVREYDEQRRTLRFVATAGPEWDDDRRGQVYDVNEPSAGAEAVRTGRPYVIADVRRQADQYRRLFAKVRSNVSIPIRCRGRIVAVLGVDWDRSNGYDIVAEPRLTRLASQCSAALEHFALYQDNWLFDLERFMADTPEVGALCAGALERIRSLFGVRGCSILLKYRGTGQLKFAATFPQRQIESIYELGHGLTGWVGQQQRILRLRDTESAEELALYTPPPRHLHQSAEDIEYGDSKGRMTFLAAPLLVRDNLIGVVRLTIKEGGAEFTSDDESLIARLSTDLALFIQNIWLNEERQRTISKLQEQNELGSKLADTLNVKAVARIVLDDGLRILGCDAGHIRLFDSVERNLKLVLAVGTRQETILPVRGIGEGISGRVYQDKMPWMVSQDDPGMDAVAREDLGMPSEEFGGWATAKACYPLMVRHQCIGTLTVHWDQRKFGEEELKLVEDIANRAAVAIQAAQLFEEIEGQLKHKIATLTHLRDLGLQFAQRTHLEELMQNILESALVETGVDSGTFRILNERGDKWVLKAASDERDPDLAEKLSGEMEVKEDLLLQAAREGIIVSLTDAQSNTEMKALIQSLDKSTHAEYLASLSWILIVPICLQKKCKGLLMLGSRKPLMLLPSTLDFLETLAGYAAVAIENAQYNEERERELRLAKPLAMMGTMLGSFEHVMRNGLQEISGDLENLASLPVAQDVGDRLQKVAKSVETLAEVMSDVAEFTQNAPTALARVDLNHALEKSVRESKFNFSGEERRPDIQFVLNLEETAYLRGNRVQLEQAFKLLLGNAVEAMPKEGTVTVRTGRKGDRIVASFEDTGVGMDSYTRDRCLEPFYTTKEKNGRRGLGLSVVYGIVTRHGGQIEFSSEPGHGTTVTLEFPREEFS